MKDNLSLQQVRIGQRTSFDDIKIINGKGYDIRQPIPVKYTSVRDRFLVARKNFWVPSEISMTDDKCQWENEILTESEMWLFKTNISYLTVGDNMVPDNLVNAIFPFITTNEMRQYLRWVIAEECFVEGTEILTDEGWKDFSKLKKNDKVAQINNDRTITFVKPKKNISYEIDDNVYRFYNKQKLIDFTVTGNHRIVYELNGELLETKAKDFTIGKIRPRKRRILTSGFKETGKHKLTLIEKFKIALAADGNLPDKRHTGKICGHLIISFTFKKKRKKERLRLLIDNIGWKYREKDYSHIRPGYTLFYVNMPITENPSKKFDWVDLNDISGIWGNEFLIELGYWDGHFCKNYSEKDYIDFWTTNKYNADVIQSIAAISNYRCHRTLKVYDNPNHKDGHRLKLLKYHNYIDAQSIIKEIIPYKGKVHCVTVDSGRILVRSNNCTCISGNSNHVESYVYILESFGLDEKGQGQIYELYQDLPEIIEKINWNLNFTVNSVLTNEPLDSPKNISLLLEDLLSYYIFEYMFFPLGFAQIFALARNGKLRNTAEQYQYIMRDELTGHAENGMWLIKQIIKENPVVWTNKLQERFLEIIDQAINLEIKHARAVMPEGGIQGMSIKNYLDYGKFLANKVSHQLNIRELYNIKSHPMSWLSEYELNQETNFFEGKVKEYQTGTQLDWE